MHPLTHPPVATPIPGASNAPNENLLPTADASTIRNWLTTKVALYLQVDPAEIDVTSPIRDFGLDSIAIFNVTGELAEWLGRNLTATLLWDFPTIDALARYLAELSELPDESL